jgi:hypothetical protein
MSGALDSSCSVHVSIAADVSCPARRNVLISKHSCVSTSAPYSSSRTCSRTRSKTSSGTSSPACFFRHRARTMEMIASSSSRTRDLGSFHTKR